MPGTTSLLAQELSNFFEAAWLELPVETSSALFGVGDEKRLRQAGWKAYDAWISLVNELTNALYSNPIVGEATGRMMETVLRLRQIGGAMAAAFFGNLWPSIGLPTQSEIIALRDELLSLREELAAYTARLSIPDSVETDTQDKLGGVWKGVQLNGYRATTSNGSMARRLADQGKRDVAA
jgi:hypothetical protein